jgi:hypothetical protein
MDNSIVGATVKELSIARETERAATRSVEPTEAARHCVPLGSAELVLSACAVMAEHAWAKRVILPSSLRDRRGDGQH